MENVPKKPQTIEAVDFRNKYPRLPSSIDESIVTGNSCVVEQYPSWVGEMRVKEAAKKLVAATSIEQTERQA